MGANVYLSNDDFELIIAATDLIGMDGVENEEMINTYDKTQEALRRLRIKFGRAKNRNSLIRIR